MASILLGDGRLLLVERVRYGTHDRIGTPRWLELVLPWVPAHFAPLLSKYSSDEVSLDRPGLIIWTRCVETSTWKTVPFYGGARFIDASGDSYVSDSSGASVGQAGFRREHYGFTTFPRTAPILRLEITENLKKSYVTALRNPHVVRPRKLKGHPLPQSKQLGDYEIRLASVARKRQPEGMPYTELWEPTWELLSAGKPAEGWEPAEWVAEDASGNRSSFLGTHQPVLRFEGLFYPKLTNYDATVVLTNSPSVKSAQLATNTIWSLEVAGLGSELRMLGLFAPGTHYFSNGVFQAKPASWWTPSVRSPSEWSYGTHRISQYQTEKWVAHMTTGPAVYVWQRGDFEPVRFGIRLRSEDGTHYPAHPLSGGRRMEITAYVFEALPEAGSFVVEVVRLDPLRAQFDVDLRQAQAASLTPIAPESPLHR